MNLLLYTICTLIWGSTWLVITFQVDAATPIASVFWRFLLGAVLLLGFCKFTRKDMKHPMRDHWLFIGQGIFMFSVNYMLVYLSETMVSSGIASICFTILLYYNIIGMRLFFKKPISSHVVWGGILGGLGMVFIFLNELQKLSADNKTLWGLGIGMTATLSASVGNMISQKTYRNGIPVVIANTYGMLYGSLFTLLVGLILHENFAIPFTARYLGSMMYLSLFGSVIAFGAYLSLAGRIGAEKAAYSGVISPIIALILSSLFEEFKWTPLILGGVALCLFGNILTLMMGQRKSQTEKAHQ